MFSVGKLGTSDDQAAASCSWTSRGLASVVSILREVRSGEGYYPGFVDG